MKDQHRAVSHRTPGPPVLPPHRSAPGLWRPGRRSPAALLPCYPATLLPCPPPLHRPAATDVTATHQPSFPTSRPTFSLQPSSRPPTLVSQIIGIQDWNCTIFGIQDWVPPTNQPASSQTTPWLPAPDHFGVPKSPQEAPRLFDSSSPFYTTCSFNPPS